MADLGDIEVSVPCGKCGKKTKKKVSRLKSNPSYVCSGCGETVEIDSGNLADKIRKAQKAIDGLGKKFR